MKPVPVILTIDDIAFGGKGVARSDGKVVFIPFTIEGEEVAGVISHQKKKFSEAQLVEVIQPSPHRVAPRCPYFQNCGGCAYQHIDYEHQLEIKQRQVEQTLRRVGGLSPVPMQLPIGSPEAYGYRNRIRVHAAAGRIGFYAWDRYDLVDIEYCPISSPAVNRALRDLRRGFISDGDYTLRGTQGGAFFEQTNPFVTAKLLDLIHRLVRREQTLLVDAYCGAGLFAKHLVDLFPRVIGIEANEAAVEQARIGASPKETYFAFDAAGYLGGVLSENAPATTTLIIDPPAAGISARVSDTILGAMPAEVLYVSCNAATLARDLALLCRAYRLESVTVLDMFPQTAEIEAVAHLVVA